ncbi:DNA lyase [Pseudoclavibacter chungangensis]|uniref:DNA lyase n=1 Tax=Pseudoclavibacter chungangensis TaxID=587635 RepID=A0A7J5BS10_9MICO|nr:pyrimidine dimer DNA glycosylase/endonuclease V [Pseudoclavibacter chungangensis]KAB1655322.1 DNA lyase [Pseudoclavibacter chungangensis]NYJ68268.1 hypothetical protein [Pseudoclavibacter chungangensis]
MRIWSLHPAYLDRQGLIAMWRESLLAVKVLRGGTKGYRNHPQLQRWRAQPDPLEALGAHLTFLVEEAEARGYNFDRTKLPDAPVTPPPLVPVTDGQLAYEREHLARKLTVRTPELLDRLDPPEALRANPALVVVPGPIESWEVVHPAT